MTHAAGVREQIASPWKHMLASVSIEEPVALHWNCCIYPSEAPQQCIIPHCAVCGGGHQGIPSGNGIKHQMWVRSMLHLKGGMCVDKRMKLTTWQILLMLVNVRQMNIQ